MQEVTLSDMVGDLGMKEREEEWWGVLGVASVWKGKRENLKMKKRKSKY